MTPSGTLTGTGARAGYPQIVVPAGYNADDARPVGIAFNGTAYSEAKLLAFAYAYEQATKLRKTPSEINPAAWRCYSGAPRACAPGREVATGVTLDFPLETATVAGPPGADDRGLAERRHADQGLPAADRADQHRGPGDQRRPRAQPEGARGGGGEGRRARRRAPSAARCTASP